MIFISFWIFLDTLSYLVTKGNVFVTSTATTNTLPSTTAITSRPTFSPPEPTKPPVPKYKRGKVNLFPIEFPSEKKKDSNSTCFERRTNKKNVLKEFSMRIHSEKLIDRSSPSWNLATRKLLCSPKATRLFNWTVVE